MVEYKFHKIANLFPLMDKQELKALAEDIKKQGLLETIALYENQILDGRNRYLACKIIKVEPRVTQWKGDNPVAWVLSKNLERRHLTPSQRAVVGVDALPLFESESKKRQKEHKGTTWGKQKSLMANVPQVTFTTSRGQAGKLVGTSGRLISDAKTIKETAPKIFKELREGKKTISQAKREIKREEMKKRMAPTIPPGKFDVIYADPPWQYDFSVSESRAIGSHYPTMKLEDICAISIPTADNSILFLWATAPKIREGLTVMREWGFEYKTCMVWVKDKIGMGYYARNQHEIILIGSKGKPQVPLEKDRVSSVIFAKRGTHSEKPPSVYKIIEKMYPQRKYLELFARKKRDGWSVWGDEVTKR